MALPKLNTPIYELEMPSTGETIKYRPFLVKEQKNLMIAMESENNNDMKNALVEIISGCTFAKVDPFAITMFDAEYLFLNFRSKSVGEKVTFDSISSTPSPELTYMPLPLVIYSLPETTFCPLMYTSLFRK